MRRIHALVLALVLPGLAHASSDARTLTAWVTASAEAVPDLAGESCIRTRQRVGGELDLADGIRFDADGSLRRAGFPSEHQTALEVFRLALTARSRAGRIAAGRFTRIDPRGLQRLDGFTVEGEGGAFVSPTLWAGRRWNPESWHTDHTWLGGGALIIRPPAADGLPSRVASITLGWEGQIARGGALGHSLFGGAALRGPGGASGHVDVEAYPTLFDLSSGAGVRGGFRAFVPVGRRWVLGPDLRWEGLPPETLPSTIRTPFDWLGDAGYGVAGLSARWGAGRWAAWASGGPVLHPLGDGERTTGGLGRVGLGWTAPSGLRLGAFGTSAGMGGSWVGGGGLEGALAIESVAVRFDGGLYRFQPLDGAAATIGESRLSARTPMVTREQGRLDLLLQVAAGTDRQLAPWVRCGVAVDARLQPRSEGR